VETEHLVTYHTAVCFTYAVLLIPETVLCNMLFKTVSNYSYLIIPTHYFDMSSIIVLPGVKVFFLVSVPIFVSQIQIW
jgi:hypothetical protein